MKWFLTLALVSILAVACAGAAPAYTPQPTVDVGTTVDAAVEATRAVERRARATSEAQAEATRAAVPTETPVPTATPVSMTLLVPTPEPFVVAPGEIEESVDKLYDCLQEDAVFRDVFFSGIRAGLAESGVSPEVIDSLGKEILGDRETFLDFLLPVAVGDPDYAVMLAVIGGMMNEVCADYSSLSVASEDALTYWVIDYDTALSALKAEEKYLQTQIEELRREPDAGEGDAESVFHVHGSRMRDLTHGALLGELFDCYHLSQDVRELMDSHARASLGIHRPYPFLSDRGGFIMVLRAFARQDPDGADRFAALDLALDAMCR